MTSRRENNVTWTQAFDFENRLTSAGNGTQTWSFVYNGDGNRVKQVAANGDVTAYVGGLYEVTYTSGGTLKNTKLYYAFGAQVVAMRDNGTLYYLHGDNLGSASLTTNASGAVVSQNRFYPFGATRFTQGTRPTDVDFIGQRLDGTGLHFYNARYYSSGLGRFVQADTMAPGAGSQVYNRYAYALSNPIRYTDPSGFCSESDGKWDSVLDCTIDDFDAMPWDQRGRWTLEFSAQTGVDKFKNIIGIIAYFRDDPVFTNSDWAKLSDAGVLFVIMDGYNRFTGNGSSCSVGGKMCGDSSGLWRDFFLAESNDQADAYEKWGRAEQSGVNYGTTIAQSLRDQAGMREQIQIDTFVGFGNAYRSLIGSGAGRQVNWAWFESFGSGGILDPGTPQSGGFVYGWSQIVVSPVSLVIYMDVLNRENNNWPGTWGAR
ncbi:MAG: RHS repeat-associated core domain-containing protein [Chloroflexi bacterium]|nr:RHS repeat-associated core domain-containing protein [Chloroflexota bacterium]